MRAISRTFFILLLLMGMTLLAFGTVAAQGGSDCDQDPNCEKADNPGNSGSITAPGVIIDFVIKAGQGEFHFGQGTTNDGCYLVTVIVNTAAWSKVGSGSSCQGVSNVQAWWDPGDPTQEPTQDPTEDPTQDPTTEPTEDPTDQPTNEPTDDPPTEEPTADPTEDPTSVPTVVPTYVPPTVTPIGDPTQQPPGDPEIPLQPPQVPEDPPTGLLNVQSLFYALMQWMGGGMSLVGLAGLALSSRK